jgi:transposase InsO family protein
LPTIWLEWPIFYHAQRALHKRKLLIGLHGVSRLHGLPRVLANDRDPKFVSGLRKTLRRRDGTSLNMSSGRHPETDGLAERFNSTFHELLRCFRCHDGSYWTNMLPQVEFAYNATRALVIEHLPSKGILGSLMRSPLAFCSSRDLQIRFRKTPQNN